MAYARTQSYGTAMTLEEIAQVLGVTRERVRQIEAEAFRKLRRQARKNPEFSGIVADLVSRRGVENGFIQGGHRSRKTASA